MKKFLVPLFFLLLINCSSDGFDSQIAAGAQKNVWCQVKGNCVEISKSLCNEIGVEIGIEKCNLTGNSSSSSDEEEVSSSSLADDMSSSSGDEVIISSSSSLALGVSSSSSSSVVDIGGSSSSIFVGDVSSSSSEAVSSSSLAPPTLSECSPFPYYVAKTKKEYIGDLVHVENDFDRCEKIKYTLSGSSSITIPAAPNDTIINFVSASSVPSSSSERSLTIKASVQCGTQTITKDCPIKVVVADNYQDSVFCSGGGEFANLTISKTTVFEYRCNTSKPDYYIKCTDPSEATFKLSVKGLADKNSEWGGANLPELVPIKINETLFYYPERVLVTVTGGGGPYKCESW